MNIGLCTHFRSCKRHIIKPFSHCYAHTRTHKHHQLPHKNNKQTPTFVWYWELHTCLYSQPPPPPPLHPIKLISECGWLYLPFDFLGAAGRSLSLSLSFPFSSYLMCAWFFRLHMLCHCSDDCGRKEMWLWQCVNISSLPHGIWRPASSTIVKIKWFFSLWAYIFKGF